MDSRGRSRGCCRLEGDGTRLEVACPESRRVLCAFLGARVEAGRMQNSCIALFYYHLKTQLSQVAGCASDSASHCLPGFLIPILNIVSGCVGSACRNDQAEDFQQL